jgi:hypothetical protein
MSSVKFCRECGDGFDAWDSPKVEFRFDWASHGG